jgi:gluconolactonase
MQKLEPVMPKLATVLCGITLLLPAAAVAQDMPLRQVLIDGEGWQLLGSGYSFTEGPAADANGNVFFTDIPNSRIYRIDAKTNKIALFAKDTAKTNGLMFGPDGRLYGCRNGDKQIVAYDSAGKVHVIAEGVNSNDLVVTSNGGIYFTDPLHRQVWYIEPKSRKKRVVAKGFYPNGIILWRDEGTLVITDRDAPHLWTYRVEPDGSLKYKERYYSPLVTEFGQQRPGSDGMTIDDAGRVYVATRVGVQVFDTTGRPSGVILKPQNRYMSNLTLGGPGFHYLYVTNGDRVYRRKVQPTGKPSVFARLKK